MLGQNFMGMLFYAKSGRMSMPTPVPTSICRKAANTGRIRPLIAGITMEKTASQIQKERVKIEYCIKGSFSVIGKEGSTEDGPGFVQRLWADANSHFAEVAHLAKKDENGNLAGIWGAMTDFSRTFQPWEIGFSKGLYLAGIECADDAVPPEGWTKWTVPGFEYLRVECDHDGVFPEMIAYLQEHGMTLAGAVHDFTCPRTGKSYLYFPVSKLRDHT